MLVLIPSQQSCKLRSRFTMDSEPFHPQLCGSSLNPIAAFILQPFVSVISPCEMQLLNLRTGSSTTYGLAEDAHVQGRAALVQRDATEYLWGIALREQLLLALPVCHRCIQSCLINSDSERSRETKSIILVFLLPFHCHG